MHFDKNHDDILHQGEYRGIITDIHISYPGKRRKGIMWNIEFKGKLKGDIDRISSGEPIPENAVRFKEPDSPQKAFAQGILIALPPFFIMLVLAIVRLVNVYSLKGVEDKSAYIKSFFPAMIVSLLLLWPATYIHEYIHAFLFPKALKKQIYVSPETYSLFVYCEECVSKPRFIVICLGPAVIQGVLPFIAAILLAPVISAQVYLAIVFFGLMMFLSGIGDFVNTFNCVRQVPKNAEVFNRGFHSYWTA